MEIIIILYFISLSVLFIFGMHNFVMLLMYFKRKSESPKEFLLPKELPQVTIQLPIYNEMYVIERLIDSVCKINYPLSKLEIQILDDSTDETSNIAQAMVSEYQQIGFDINYIHRDNREGFKAGALRSGLAKAKGQLIAIFDADFLPNPDFLNKTIPHFQDKNVGMVQTRWSHLNEQYNFLTRSQAMALDSHFAIEQEVRNKSGFFMNFNGTAGIWRAETIFDAGNWQDDTLTEDLDLSYRAQLRGWKFIYCNDVSSPAELPVSINALKSQQFRWTKGAIETAKKILPKILKSDLPLKIKIESFFHLTNNIIYPFIVLVAILNIPIVIIKNIVIGYDHYFVIMSVFILALFATFLVVLFAQKSINLDWRKRLLLFPIYLAGSMGLAINNSKAILEVFFNKKTEFIRTPKYNIKAGLDSWLGKKYKSKGISLTIIFELLIGVYYLFGIIISIYYNELAIIPFQFLFFLGFGTVGLMSIKQLSEE